MSTDKHMPGPEQHWTAEENRNYDPAWVIRYNPMPGGRKNADGTTTLSMTFPALQLTGWVGEPEKAAHELAAALNSHGKLVEAVKHCEALLLRHEINTVNGEELSDGALNLIRAALASAGQPS